MISSVGGGTEWGGGEGRVILHCQGMAGEGLGDYRWCGALKGGNFSGKLISFYH